MEIGKMKKITFILITIFSLVCLFSCEKKTGWGGKKLKSLSMVYP